MLVGAGVAGFAAGLLTGLLTGFVVAGLVVVPPVPVAGLGVTGLDVLAGFVPVVVAAGLVVAGVVTGLESPVLAGFVVAAVVVPTSLGLAADGR